MKKRQRRGEPRHPAVVAADVQPMSLDEGSNRRRVVPLGRPEQGDRARPLAERNGESGYPTGATLIRLAPLGTLSRGAGEGR